jgi:hypothetical protein
MTNHFRTLLLNLSYGNDPNEHIPLGFAARQLQGGSQAVHNVLFDLAKNRGDISRLGLAYLELVRAANLDRAFTLVDDRITYDLDEDFNYFGLTGIDLDGLYAKLVAHNEDINNVLKLTPAIEDDTFENLWRKHPNIAYRIAGLIVAYVLRLA